MAPSIPNVPFIERHMILLQKRAHLILKTSFAVVHRLPVDVLNERADVRRADGKQGIAALPCKLSFPLLFHPGRRAGLDLGDELRGGPGRRQPNRKMNVVGGSACSKALAIQFARCSREIGMQGGGLVAGDGWKSLFGAEDDVDQIEAQRLGHGRDYMPGLQPSPDSGDPYLGLPDPNGQARPSGAPVRPRLVCRRTFGPHGFSGYPKQLAGPCVGLETVARSKESGTQHEYKRQRRDNIPAWAEGPGNDRRTERGLKARYIAPIGSARPRCRATIAPQ